MAEFWQSYALPGLIMIGYIVAIILPLILVVAMLTYAERKVLAAIQRLGEGAVHLQHVQIEPLQLR